jgi:phosphate transport system protein
LPIPQQHFSESDPWDINMSHYEERLENDLTRIRNSVSDMAEKVETAVKNALHALHTGNSKLAAATVLADHPINRSMRRIDQLAHSFIALHLPSAGHLRMLSYPGQH